MAGALTRERGGSMSAQASQVEMILAKIEALPTLPAVAMRLIELTSQPGSAAREVVQLVESDPSIAAKILSLARRTNLGLHVTTVERAVLMLGFDALRSLALSMQVFDAFSDRGQGGELDLYGLWKHGLAVGCGAYLLAEAINSGHARARTH